MKSSDKKKEGENETRTKESIKTERVFLDLTTKKRETKREFENKSENKQICLKMT